jgi:arsenate reductase
MTISIFHNPRCSKSRQTLEILNKRRVDTTVIEYLQTPPSPGTLLKLAESLNVAVADLLRRGEPEFSGIEGKIALDDDTAIAEAISKHPILLQRPIVLNNETGQAVIGRPPENVLRLL